jgi:transposase
MNAALAPVTVGVDTHLDAHVAAVCDPLGRTLDTATFPTTLAGYADLVAWARSHGDIDAVGIEGTGCWGAGLTRFLTDHDIPVVEVLRPDRRDRRHNGKSDTIDAEAAARAVLAGTATNTPKSRDGVVEAIRALRSARDGAVKARSAVRNRAELQDLTWTRLIAACADLRPGDITDPAQACKAALASMARRWTHLHAEVTALDRQLDPLVTAAAPQLLERTGIGVHSAADLLITIGDNPQRIATEASFARLCGVAPLPASSGKIVRHRLNPGGDRRANRALYTIVITRMRIDERTRDYVRRRTAQGRSTREIIRCLKRYVAREIYRDLTTPTHTPEAR